MPQLTNMNSLLQNQRLKIRLGYYHIFLFLSAAALLKHDIYATHHYIYIQQPNPLPTTFLPYGHLIDTEICLELPNNNRLMYTLAWSINRQRFSQP
jgi:hypothetical protein